MTRFAPAVVIVAGCAQIAGIPSFASSDGGDVSPDVPIGPLTPYEMAVMADSPAGYFHLDEAGGLYAADATGNGSGEYVADISYGQDGAFGASRTSIGFDGSDCAITLGDRFAYFGNQPFTLEAWIYPVDFDTDYHQIGSRWKQPTNRSGYTWFQSGSNFGFERDIGDAETQLDQAQAFGVFPTERWYYVAATYDGATMRIYVDGAQVAAQASTLALVTNAMPAMIGAASNDPKATPFHGDIDEYAVYDHALGSDHISAHYAAAMVMMP